VTPYDIDQSSLDPNMQLLGLDKLRKRVERDLEYLDVPRESWVEPYKFQRFRSIYDAVIVGAGMCGLAAGYALRLAGITNFVLYDKAPQGLEGPWLSSARMPSLRSPKELAGLAFGTASLTFRAWYEAKYGLSSWSQLHRIPTHDWAHYLRWYREALRLPVINDVRIDSIEADAEGVWRLVSQPNDGRSSNILLSKKVILATGFLDLAKPRVPAPMASIPRGLWAHSSEPLSASALQGKRIVVVGAGASAIDNALYAADFGASHVTVLIRRVTIPRINRLMAAQSPGFAHGYHDSSDDLRWQFMKCASGAGVPPTRESIQRLTSRKNISVALDTEVINCRLAGSHIVLETTTGKRCADFVILATGFRVDLSACKLLDGFSQDILLWRDIYGVAAQDSSELSYYPYLGAAYQFLDRSSQVKSPLADVHCFNQAALLSHGEVGTTIPYICEGALRLVHGIAVDLFKRQCEEQLHVVKTLNKAEFSQEDMTPVLENTPIQESNNCYVTLRESRYHYVWLRDNCQCSECHDPVSHQKKSATLDLPSAPQPKVISEHSDYVEVTWEGEPAHTSRFAWEWLAKNRYDAISSRNSVCESIHLWDRKELAVRLPKRFDARNANVSDWTSELKQMGFVVVENLEPSGVDAVVDHIGPILETEYGRIHVSRADSQSRIPDLSMTSTAMSVHTDSTFREITRLVQFLHCIENAAIGGETVLVDGFRVAEEMRSRYSPEFELLRTTPVSFSQWNPARSYMFVRNTPILQCRSHSDTLEEVFMSQRNAVLSVPFKDTVAFYEAYRCFCALLSQESFQYEFKLKPGDCLLAQNWRVLHGRRAFDLDSGPRHLNVWYVPWLYFQAKQRFRLESSSNEVGL
jgi:cation diffusion facilitator CzcD-associated flavoprotein CzcO/alpha-ketoglutarate-dependent taurine dioxygenase